jgi:hypothetical protein
LLIWLILNDLAVVPLSFSQVFQGYIYRSVFAATTESKVKKETHQEKGGALKSKTAGERKK